VRPPIPLLKFGDLTRRELAGRRIGVVVQLWPAPGRIQDLGYAPSGGVANADAAGAGGW